MQMAQIEMLLEVDELLAEAKKALNTLKEVEAKASVIADAKEQAFYYKDVVKVAMDALRAPIDQLEMVVDSTVWPIPTYGDLMFEVQWKMNEKEQGVDYIDYKKVNVIHFFVIDISWRLFC